MLPNRPRLTNEKFLGQLKRAAARFPCYGHVRTFVYIDRDGDITLDAHVEPWHTQAVARAIATRGKSFHEGVTDHLIASYIRRLRASPAAPAAKRRSPGVHSVPSCERDEENLSI